MNTFPLDQDEYSVEEISYDDMMSILSIQGKESTDTQMAPEFDPSKQEHSRQDDISRRISENAKQELPDWLINH